MSLFTFLGVLAIFFNLQVQGGHVTPGRIVKRDEGSNDVQITQLDSWELPKKYVDENNDKEIQRFRIKSEKVTLEIMSLDLAMTSLKLPDDNSTMSDVVLGFDDISGYLKNPSFSGVFVSLTPEDMAAKTKTLRNWIPTQTKDKLFFSLIEDEEVMINAEFAMDKDGKLRVTFKALVSEPTFLNVAIKQYFNLAGHASGISGLNEQIIQVNAAEVTESPEGDFVGIEGHELDLRVPKNIGSLISNKNITFGRSFIMDRSIANYDRFVTRISHGISRRFVEVYSNQPRLYFDVFDKASSPGKGSEEYEPMGGVEISTNTLSEEKELSTVIPGTVYTHIVVYRFGVDEF